MTLSADQVNPVAISTGGGTVTLRVRRGTNLPAAGVPWYLFDGAGTYLGVSRTTDQAGEAALALGDGGYRVRADLLGGQFWSEPFALPGTTQVTLELGGGALTVAVGRQDATPLPGTATYLFDAAGASYLGLSRVGDGAGEAIFDVPDGTYTVRADLLGYQFRSAQVTVGADARMPLLIPHRQLSVALFGDDGISVEPGLGVAVYLFTPGGEYLGRSSATDVAGRAYFELPERDYQVRADYLTGAYWATLAPRSTSASAG